MAATGGTVEVSVVLPVFNEEGHLAAELDRITESLTSAGITFELIVVDDGSTDRSAEVAAAHEKVRLIRFPTNRGSGTARRAGTLLARGSVVVWTDADMSYPNDEIPRLVRELAGRDQVVGWRSTEQGTLRLLRVPAKLLIRRLAEYLTGTRIPDLNSGFRAFRRDVGLQFLHLLPAGFSCVTTMTLAFLSNGYDVAYMPIVYAKRAGKSKFHWWSDTRRYALQVVRMVMFYDPLRVFMPLGGLLAAVGIIKVPFDLVNYDLRLANSTQILLLAAMIIGLLGLLADLIVKVNSVAISVFPAGWRLEPGGE